MSLQTVYVRTSFKPRPKSQRIYVHTADYFVWRDRHVPVKHPIVPVGASLFATTIGVRRLVELLWRVIQNLSRHDQALHLTRAFIDIENASVTKSLLREMLVGNSHRPKNLDTRLRYPTSKSPAHCLTHRRFDLSSAFVLFDPLRPNDHSPCRFPLSF